MAYKVGVQIILFGANCIPEVDWTCRFSSQAPSNAIALSRVNPDAFKFCLLRFFCVFNSLRIGERTRTIKILGYGIKQPVVAEESSASVVNHTPFATIDNTDRKTGSRRVEADDGLTSSSSAEEERQTLDIIRRKRAQSLPGATNNKPDGVITNMADVKGTNTNVAENLLWIVSAARALYEAYQARALPNTLILGEWVALLLLGLVACYYVPQTVDPKHATSYSATSSDDQAIDTLSQNSNHAPRTDRVRDENCIGKSPPENVTTSRSIFGAHRLSYRTNADDGLACGVSLLPIVAVAKVVEVAQREMDTMHTDLSIR
ncbi:hypothetical protein EC973_003145 [Apophysomyces ossiformis]|uniref:Uncharacterized protein n=1 Tax=Apophysomyces ossiformis TaxID=679940 RepID=A0A8H7BLS1_9FUNG|nr:hypothetical protein EC973_003145 [Apophysomyces ossiformis]